jgi:hypothetical protein
VTQDPAPSHDLLLRDYRPRSCVRVPQHPVARASVAAVDAHNHLGRWATGETWSVADVAGLLELMDACNVTAMVNLDGRWGDELEANLDRYDRRWPGRFATFCHVDWDEARSPGFPDRLVSSLTHSASRGAKGLKVWKDLGLRVEDPGGDLLLPDDPRLAPLWEAAGELNLPILIHTADPVAFFLPVDRFNERLEELLAHPDWSFCAPHLPSFERLIDALEAIVASHPRTTFIGAHVGCYAEDLTWVSRMLDTYPNFFVDIGARIAELGRQPRSSRRLMLEHPDRVLFGTDHFPPTRDALGIYFRFLETDDECFPYSTDEVPSQGRWDISGIHLPDDVLRQVYRGNALRLIPTLAGAAGGRT